MMVTQSNAIYSAAYPLSTNYQEIISLMLALQRRERLLKQIFFFTGC